MLLQLALFTIGFIFGGVTVAVLLSRKFVDLDKEIGKLEKTISELRNRVVGIKAEAAASKITLEALQKIYGPFPDFAERLELYNQN